MFSNTSISHFTLASWKFCVSCAVHRNFCWISITKNIRKVPFWGDVMDHWLHIIIVNFFVCTLFVHTDGFTLSHTIARIMEGIITQLNGETNSSIWPGSSMIAIILCLDGLLNLDFRHADVAGEIPPIVTVFTVVIVPVYAYLATLVTVGLVLCFVCLLFNIIFRKRK